MRNVAANVINIIVIVNIVPLFVFRADPHSGIIVSCILLTVYIVGFLLGRYWLSKVIRSGDKRDPWSAAHFREKRGVLFICVTLSILTLLLSLNSLYMWRLGFPTVVVLGLLVTGFYCLGVVMGKVSTHHRKKVKKQPDEEC